MPAEDGLIKVGHSYAPERRRRALGYGSVAHVSTAFANARDIERATHKVLTLAGKHVRQELFSATVQEAKAAIEEAVAETERELSWRYYSTEEEASELAGIDRETAKLADERHSLAVRRQLIVTRAMSREKYKRRKP